MFNPVIDIAVIVAFAALFAIPVAIEYRKKKAQPKPRGATKF
ncbi:hypothetical protein LU11_gp390 [Pseudomonas phage Lu11]|nr:hypothetical protein LU11_gp390 [Pseudomonas phage Lu11]AFH14921.1 hypothetical protein Lu11_0383 [Pseudomonas phage Lu11]